MVEDIYAIAIGKVEKRFHAVNSDWMRVTQRRFIVHKVRHHRADELTDRFPTGLWPFYGVIGFVKLSVGWAS